MTATTLCSLDLLPYQADPSHYFSVIQQAPGAVLLDSGRPTAERGRFDICSAWPLALLKPSPTESGAEFFQRLRLALAELGPATLPSDSELPFAGGLIGYLGYDFGRHLEAYSNSQPDELQLPDAQLGLYPWALISDHHNKTTVLVSHPSLLPAERQRLLRLFSQAPSKISGSWQIQQHFEPEQSPDAYQQAFDQIQAYIASGDCYQINYAQRFHALYQGEPWQAYQRLRRACPTPFAGYCKIRDNSTLLSLSPERFIRLSQGQVETRPIKGTRPRHPDPELDQKAADELRNSPKDRAENLMIVDLLRNDLGRTCEIGSVQVPELFSLESYPNVHHLTSCVSGRLAKQYDAFDLLAGSFPGGSITGAPKIRAMQIIDELEHKQRGPYCGSLLYVDVRGEMDSSITIRSLLLENGHAYCWGGGGIVADSNWQAEYQESLDKVSVLLHTLEQP